jgi:quercetin dioxygenase-like cupin family protein
MAVGVNGDGDFSIVSIDDCQSVPAYDAELIFLRHGLGATAFGMQVERLPAHYGAYAEHDEKDSGQEEIYTLIEGSARLLVGSEEHRLRPGVFARVGPNTLRKIVTDEEPALLLCLGGRPGGVYEPPAWTDPSLRPASRADSAATTDPAASSQSNGP